MVSFLPRKLSVVSAFSLGCHLTQPIFVVHRKLTPSPKLNIQKSWTKPPTSPSWADSWIRGWAPLTGISSVKLVVKGCRSVRAILVILSWQDLSSILVRAVQCDTIRSLTDVAHPPKGFIVKVKKILESICVNCGKLKADIVSRVSFPLLVSHPHNPIFWGLSP